MDGIIRRTIFTEAKSNTMALKNRIEFINVLHSIFNAENDADMDATLMAFEGLMTGHGVTWADFSTVYHNLRADMDPTEAWAKLKPFSEIRDYFEYEVNTVAMGNDVDAFAALCDRCMDFSLLSLGVRVNNLQTVEGPY